MVVVFTWATTTCRTEGIDSVHLKMLDGAIRKLGEVDIPGLKRNRILLGVLDSKGYRITMDGGTLRVARGALVVINGTR